MKKLWLVFVIFILLFASNQPGSATIAPEAPLYGTNSPSSISGQYIVVYKPGFLATNMEKTSQEIVALGGTILYQYSSALTGYAAILPDQALSTVRQDPNVAYVEMDQVVTIDTTQSPATWGIDRIDQRALPLTNSYTYESTGVGVNAYIIDTGILASHNEFGGRASVAYDSVGDGKNGVDCNGHGTHVAGTVGGTTYGVAKGVMIYAVRVLNCSGSGTTSGVIAGVDWVTVNHTDPAVANMSLGGGVSNSLDTAVKNSIFAGVTYSLSAGNSNRDACKFSPARVSTALTVGATTSTDSRASYSNYGTCLDIFAPGSSITSAWNTSNTATNTISGTSMAAPHVTGVVALYLQAHPNATPADIANALKSAATANVVKNPGRNSPNLLLYSTIP